MRFSVAAHGTAGSGNLRTVRTGLNITDCGELRRLKTVDQIVQVK